MDTLPKYLRWQKQIAETPLQAIARLQSEYPELKDQKLAYAGRLDPQASGELIILVGDECRRRDFYQQRDKIYQFDLLTGISTDTGDVMGLITQFADNTSVAASTLTDGLANFLGKQSQQTPIYSSQRVQGKALWQWAKSGQLNQIKIPSREIEVYDLQVQTESRLSAQDLLTDVINRVSHTQGNFRQAEIMTNWQETFQNLTSEFSVFSIVAKVSSGTYIRQLAMDLGAYLQVPAMCWHIHRQEVIIPAEY